jgi:hypothetical protein
MLRSNGGKNYPCFFPQLFSLGFFESPDQLYCFMRTKLNHSCLIALGTRRNASVSLNFK